MLNQNEVGGKDLLLKIANVLTLSLAVGDTATAGAAHNLKVGDLVKFNTVDANTTIAANKIYYVVNVPTSTTFKISATKGGSPIAFDDAATGIVAYGFSTLGGLRSKSFSFSVDGVDITNHDSDEWKTMLDGAGVRSVSLSGSGVYTNQEGYQTFVSNAFANQMMLLAFIDVRTSRVFVGYFKITSVETSGDHDAEGSYSISADSSGEIIVTVAAVA